MNQEERICSWADELIAARLVECRPLFIPFLGMFRSVFHKEYIHMDNGMRLLMPPRVSISFEPADYILTRQRYTSMELSAPESFFSDEFITNLADLHGCQEEECRHTLAKYSTSFLKGVFRGRKMAFLGLGAFYARETSPGCLLLYYEPFKALLCQLNQPFLVYKPVSIPAHINFSDLEEYAQIEEDPEAYPFVISSPEELPKEKVENTEVAHKEDELQETNETNEKTPETLPKPVQRKFPLWLLIVVAVGLVIALLLFLLKPQPPTLEVVDTDAPVVSIPQLDTSTVRNDSIIEPVIEEPVADVPLDSVTISGGVTLAKLARKYYGNSFYWVYIYMANDNEISDPDNVPMGKRLIIAPLSWFGIEEVNEQTLKEAKAWANIILSKHYKSFEEQRSEVQGK